MSALGPLLAAVLLLPAAAQVEPAAQDATAVALKRPSPMALPGARFSPEGKFLSWHGPRSWNARVIVVAGEEQQPLWSNASDAANKAITVRDFLNRAHRVHGEGRGVFASHYAWAQDNLRVKSGGKEADNYAWMKNWSAKLNEGIGAQPSYAPFYAAKKDLDLAKLNEVTGAQAAIRAELELLQGGSKDPTDGATQWRGADLSAYDYHKALLERGKTDKTALESYGLKNRLVVSYQLLKKSRLHLFFAVTAP